MSVMNVMFREGKVRVQIKFPATDALLLRVFDETDLLAAVVDYAKEVSFLSSLCQNAYPYLSVEIF